MKRRIESFPLACALFFAAFTALYLVATHQGNLKTNDSLNYLAIARNLAAGNGFIDADGDPVVYWPPLYPLVLRLGIGNPGTFVFGLHLLSMGGVFWLWLRIAGRQLESRKYVLLYGAYLVTATPLLMIATFVWSEALFLLLFSAYLVLLGRYVHTLENRWLMWAAAPGFLMLLGRNAGMFLFAGAMLGLLLTVGKRLSPKHLLLHAVLVVWGSAAWNVDRLLLNGNQHVFGQLLPVAPPLTRTGWVVGELAANFLPLQPLAPVGIALVIGLLVSFAWLRGTARVRQPFILLLWVVIVTYATILVIIKVHPDDISRLVSPVLPAFYLVLLRNVLALEELAGAGLRTVLWLAALGGLAYPVVRVVHNALRWGGVKPAELVNLINVF